MTESSAKRSSDSDPRAAPDPARRFSLSAHSVHIWLGARQQHACSDSFKRRVLSQYAAVAPAAWRFGRGAQGKPYLVGSAQALDFNLSHSGDWLACAVTAGVPVGVDIEACKPQRDVMTLARRFFREEEVMALEACTEAGQRDRFYDLWTLKEAAVKARGAVLVSGLDSRGFALARNPGAAGTRVLLTTDDDPGSAQYCLLDPVPGYRLAVCWLPAAPLAPALQLYELGAAGVSSPDSGPLRASSWLH
ncbi:MAG: 4'-phosphopantetheinyl transferase superfamily protein [Halioglobus sp.]|nr:4'-phosphopantetheinyl transferase superfamily protein [Halioglobus sp.]